MKGILGDKWSKKAIPNEAKKPKKPFSERIEKPNLPSCSICARWVLLIFVFLSTFYTVFAQEGMTAVECQNQGGTIKIIGLSDGSQISECTKGQTTQGTKLYNIVLNANGSQSLELAGCVIPFIGEFHVVNCVGGLLEVEAQKIEYLGENCEPNFTVEKKSKQEAYCKVCPKPVPKTGFSPDLQFVGYDSREVVAYRSTTCEQITYKEYQKSSTISQTGAIFSLSNIPVLVLIVIIVSLIYFMLVKK